MRKLSTKKLNTYPELGALLQNIDAKKAALKGLKQQKIALKEELKAAEKALKKQLKDLPKTRKAEVTLPQPEKKKRTTVANKSETAVTKRKPASRSVSVQKKITEKKQQ